MSIFERLSAPISPPSESDAIAAQARQATLTKPPGSLGKLEDIAERFAGFQGSEQPQLDHILIAIFAGDHGIAAQGVSAFPQVVTGEMLKNFARGGAAINVLAQQHQAHLVVINTGTVVDLGEVDGVIDAAIGPGTEDFSQSPAMTESQCAMALEVGQTVVSEAGPLDLFIGGEMGIGNTTSAAAILSQLMDVEASALCGRGTGIDDERLVHKTALVNQALELHEEHIQDGYDCLQRLGGFEIAALVGAYLSAAHQGIPSLIDGFIATSAAALAIDINPSIKPWLLFAHRSDEQGHRLALEYLEVEPLIDLSLRLGEASGAAVCLPLIRSALLLHTQMATFEEAEVSDG